VPELFESGDPFIVVDAVAAAVQHQLVAVDLDRPRMVRGMAVDDVDPAVDEPMREPDGKRRMPFEYPWQRDVLASQRAFDAQVPPNARIGCFNAGIPAYFGAHTVVNLDGLVNHDLVEVYRRRELDRWLAGEKIEFVADEPMALGRAQKLTKNPIRLTTVTTSPLHGWATPTRFLWRVEAR